MADEEWTEIKRVTGAEHGKLVGTIADRLLVPTSYAPALLHASEHEASRGLVRLRHPLPL